MRHALPPARGHACKTRKLRPAACLPAAAALALCLLLASRVTCASGAAPRAVTQSGATLTPIQARIARERERLNSPDAEERRDAVLRLGALGRPDASRAAGTALGDPSVIVRASAARALLSLPAEEAAVLLLPLLADKNEFVRRETAYSLGETRSPAATPTLITTLQADKEAGVRGAAAVALGRIADVSAVPALSQSVGGHRARGRREDNEFVRRAAAVALGQTGSREGVPALVAALSDERAPGDVRREAARALALIADPSAAPALRAALTASDPYLSLIAREALLKLEPAGAARPT